MTQSSTDTKRVAEDRRRNAGREERHRKWRAAALARERWTPKQLGDEEVELMAIVAEMVARGEVQRLAGGAALNTEEDPARYLEEFSVDAEA